MTKYMFLIFLFAILTQISNGQITNYREDVIVNNDIERIDEWKFKFDSLGKLIDSVFLRQLTFNKGGDLIEKRTQYEDHPWTTEEVWAVFKYTYDDNHNLINSQENINYIFVAASDEYRKLINKCETYDFYGNLITAVLTYENDKIDKIFNPKIASNYYKVKSAKSKNSIRHQAKLTFNFNMIFF